MCAYERQTKKKFSSFVCFLVIFGARNFFSTLHYFSIKNTVTNFHKKNQPKKSTEELSPKNFCVKITLKIFWIYAQNFCVPIFVLCSRIPSRNTRAPKIRHKESDGNPNWSSYRNPDSRLSSDTREFILGARRVQTTREKNKSRKTCSQKLLYLLRIYCVYIFGRFTTEHFFSPKIPSQKKGLEWGRNFGR